MSFSFKDFTGRNLTTMVITPQIIERSCFSQERPDTEIFPSDMGGVTFINCNLDNVKVPEGNIVIDCSTRRFAPQSDGNDWEVDELNNPIQSLNAQFYFDKYGTEIPSPDILE